MIRRGRSLSIGSVVCRSISIAVVAAVASTLAIDPRAQAQSESGPPASTIDAGPYVALRREGLTAELDALRVELAGLSEADARFERLSRNLDLRERIDGVYLRWLEQVDRASDLARQR